MPRSRRCEPASGTSPQWHQQRHDLSSKSATCPHQSDPQFISQRTDGLTRTTPSSTAAGLDTVLLQVSEIRMAGSRVEVHGAVSVVLRPLILVTDDHTDRCSESDAKLCPGLDLNSVLLISGSRESTLARSAAGHLRLDIILGEFHPWGTAIDDTADRAAMRFAIAENMSVEKHNSYGIS